MFLIEIGLNSSVFSFFNDDLNASIYFKILVKSKNVLLNILTFEVIFFIIFLGFSYY